MKIAVLVDLELSDKSGGHVKYWQRICESLKPTNNEIDITIFYLGKKKESIFISERIRYELIKPILSSNILKILGIDADITDLFPINFRLLLRLKKYDLVHTTDQFFAMSKTAKLATKIWDIPLTTSIHTDTPPYTKYYVKKVLSKIFSIFFRFDKLLIESFKIPEHFEKKMYKKIYKYISNIDHAMVADRIYSPEFLIKKTRNKNITKLNRGINKNIFFIKKENRINICRKFNIPLNDKIIFFTGRIHELKGALLLSKIHKKLIEKGHSITTIMAGQGAHEKECKIIAGKKLNLIGYLSHEEISCLYRVCDLFVFPSQFEIGPNVVIEAKACGAICVVSPDGGGKRIYKPNLDGIIVKNYELNEWINSIEDLLYDKKKIRTIKSFLKNQKILTWDDIFLNDILPFWKKLVNKRK